MAKIDKLIAQARPYLEPGEQIHAAIQGTYETKVLGSAGMRSGVMLATDRRIVFYARKFGGHQWESFGYGNVSAFETGPHATGHHVRFTASGNDISLKWINAGDIDLFARLLRQRVGHRSPTRPGRVSGGKGASSAKMIAKG